MADIFGKITNNFGGSMSADGAAVVFSGSGNAGALLGVGMIVQQVNIGYQQQVTRLYEIGSANTYYVAGRVQGNLTIGRVVGPGVVLAAFYAAFGNVCNAGNNVLNLFIGTGCAPAVYGGGGSVSTKFENGRFTLSYCVLVSVGISVGAQDMVINEQLQLMFINMSNQSGGTFGTGGGPTAVQ